MTFKLIKSNHVEEINRGFIKVKKLLNEDDISNLSVSIVKIDGVNKKIVNTKSDSVYFVLEGSGFFNIDGKEVGVEKGDLIFIRMGSAYFDSGKLTMLAINNPRYDQSAIKYLE